MFLTNVIITYNNNKKVPAQNLLHVHWSDMNYLYTSVYK